MHQVQALKAIAAGLLVASLLAACDDPASHKAAADAKVAADRTGAGIVKTADAAATALNTAGARATPAIDKAADQLDAGIGAVGAATAKVARKAGDAIDKAGAHAQAAADRDAARHGVDKTGDSGR